jgi:hypothetical protein
MANALANGMAKPMANGMANTMANTMAKKCHPNPNPNPNPKPKEVTDILALPLGDTSSQNSETTQVPEGVGVAMQTEKKASEDRGRPLIMHASLPKAAWAMWLEYRKRHRMPMDDQTLAMQLKHLALFSEDAQTAMIETSINAGWQGLFPPKGVKLDAPKQQRLRPAAEILAEEERRADG